jgi:hypothetical protein
MSAAWAPITPTEEEMPALMTTAPRWSPRAADAPFGVATRPVVTKSES